MLLTKALTYLVMPLSMSFILFAIAGLLVWRGSFRLGLLGAASGTMLLLLASTPWVASTLARGLESAYPPAAVDTCYPAEAIVLLGGAIRPPYTGDPTPRLNGGSDRIWTAAGLFHSHCAPQIFIAAGGDIEPPAIGPEAQAILAFLVDLDVPRSAIELEDRSRNTAENAREAWADLSTRGVRRILLVTSAWHLRRATREFERAGFSVIPVGSDYLSFDEWSGLEAWLPDAEALATTQLMWKEYLGFWWYSLKSQGD